MNAVSLLEAPTEEVLRGTEPAPVRRAEAALARAEATGADADVSTFVRESLDWLDFAVQHYFAGHVAPQHLSRVRLLAVQAPLQALYSAWRVYEPEHGLWLAYVDRLREIAEDFGVPVKPLTRRAPHQVGAVAEETPPNPRLLKLVSDEVTALLGARTRFDEIRDTLDLSWPELARILRVRRQAIAQWRVRGVPPARSGDLDRLLEACRFLKSRLKRERVPQIVRAPSERLDGRSMLDLAAAEGPAALLEHLRALFSYQLM